MAALNISCTLVLSLYFAPASLLLCCPSACSTAAAHTSLAPCDGAELVRGSLCPQQEQQ